MSTVRGQQHSFSTHERVFLGKIFWDRKCLYLRGTRTPNLRIHAECSKLLSYQGQTFAVPCFFNTGSGGVGIFLSKVNVWNVDRARATAFIFNTQALIWNLKVKFMGVVIGQGNTMSPVSNWFTSIFLLTSIWQTIHNIQLFEIWLWKNQCHIIIIIVTVIVIVVVIIIIIIVIIIIIIIIKIIIIIIVVAFVVIVIFVIIIIIIIIIIITLLSLLFLLLL